MERVRPNDYFRDERPRIFIPSGCALMDCVLGGGWPLGRTSNIVGDKSTGKTLLAIEACANFHRKFPDGNIWYRESEAAFDVGYAAHVGLPLKQVDFGDDGIDTLWDTIEDVVSDILAVTARERAKPVKKQKPGLYIIDSLDALSDNAERDRAIGDGSYGASKAKMLSELFRRCTREIKATQIHLMIVSQIRDRIGVRFGEKYGRSGGHALDFYASQVLWLHHLKNIVQVRQGIKRVTAIAVQARCKKNKIGLSLRDCAFNIRFGYGIEDIEASLAWLAEVGQLARVIPDVKKYQASLAQLSETEFEAKRVELHGQIKVIWDEIESGFAPPRRKYAL